MGSINSKIATKIAKKRLRRNEAIFNNKNLTKYYFFIQDFCSSLVQTALHSCLDISVQQAEDFIFLLFFLSLFSGESAANEDIDKPTKTAINAIDFFIFPSVIFIFTRSISNCVPN
ncbi:hypothetical protein EGI31_16790 [Lacihabitans soyangensis]|uniref:Uncharacterized protein n=1 Tax=Lacihabitans soyangensis TaxID=869394 RepID=A0AAE3H3S2_9BACT|nr:hypothetical protein [Lacihabitans soyangensis]